MNKPLDMEEVASAIKEAVEETITKFGIPYVRQLSMFPSSDNRKKNQ